MNTRRRRACRHTRRSATPEPLARGGLIVEADVSRNERHAQFARRARQAVDSRDERPICARLLRIAVVQAVGQRCRRRADRDDVADRFDDGVFGGALGIEHSIARIAGDRERAAERRAGDGHDQPGVGISARDRRRAAHDGIESLVNRAARTDVAMSEHAQKHVASAAASRSSSPPTRRVGRRNGAVSEARRVRQFVGTLVA